MSNDVKTVYKSLGLCGFGLGSNSAAVDVKDGKILRIRPMHYDDAYDIADMRPWRIEVNGAVLEPKDKTMPSPLQYAYKKRVYSKNRVPYPLIRVDWDPNGDRHPETRGISKYRRISWDEATDIIASELKRIHKEYGPLAVLAQVDGHGESKMHPRSARLPRQAARPDGRLHAASPPARQLGRLDLGCQAHLGHGPGRQAGPRAEPLPGHRRERRRGAVLGRRP